ncbi:hypothetical protein [Isoptericola sediminis]|uniref:Uncharacterized protein n=1 Tax=Isoptericola sediminis TaxID=2733572 RepID=A0A849KH92_9MICO|nr:hypothetical protein [Isoptericola sediminis]NNU27973.1 hypothetical protein [Isoptericola sediminis]
MRHAAPGRDCSCGCGGLTRGGKFLPGHDSRHATTIRNTWNEGEPEEARRLARAVGWDVDEVGRVKHGPPARRRSERRPRGVVQVVSEPGPSGTLRVACPGDCGHHLFAPGAAGREVETSCGRTLQVEPLTTTATSETPATQRKGTTMKYRPNSQLRSGSGPLGAAPALEPSNRPPAGKVPAALQPLVDEWDQFKAKYKAAVKDLDATGDGSAAMVEAKQADRRRAAQILRDTGEYPTDPTPNYDAVVARRDAARAFLDTAEDQASLISADYHREYLKVAADPTWQTQHDQARANVHTAAQALIDAIVQADEVDEMATWATTGQPFNNRFAGNPVIETDDLPIKQLDRDTGGVSVVELLGVVASLYDEYPAAAAQQAAQAAAQQEAQAFEAVAQARAEKEAAALEAQAAVKKSVKDARKPQYLK